MFEKKKDDYVQEPTIKHSHQMEKKEQSIIKTYQEPVMPRLCRIIFLLMIVVTAALLLADINAYVRYDSYLGFWHLFRNIAMTGFWSWLLFSIILVLLSLWGSYRNRKGYYKRKKESGIVDKSVEEKKRSGRALKRMNQFYFLYIWVSIIGSVIWGIIYLLSVFN